MTKVLKMPDFWHYRHHPLLQQPEGSDFAKVSLHSCQRVPRHGFWWEKGQKWRKVIFRSKAHKSAQKSAQIMEILEETVSQQRTVAFWRFFHRFSRLFKCENMCQPSSRSTHFCIGAIFKTPHHYDAQHNNGDWMMACSMLAHFSTKNWQIWLIWTKLSNFLSKFENNGKLYLLYSFSALFSKEISLISRKNWQIWLFWTKIQYLFARIWKNRDNFTY